MLIVAAIACLLGATVQSSIGFGFALVLAPALFAAVEPREALTTMLLLNLTINVVLLGTERRPREVRVPEVRRMLITAVPALIAGALVFESLTKEVIQIAVGVLVIVATGLDARSTLPRLRAGRSEHALPLGAAYPLGAATGFLTTTTTTNGPPMVLLLRARGVSPAELRDSNAAMLLVLASGALAMTALVGGALRFDPVLVGSLVSLTVGGQYLGRFVFARLDPARFHTAGLVVVLAAGLASLAAGLASAL